MPIETPFNQALRLAHALPGEDIILLLRALLARFDESDWPTLFDGRAVEEVERLVVTLWLRLDPEGRAGTLATLVEHSRAS